MNKGKKLPQDLPAIHWTLYVRDLTTRYLAQNLYEFKPKAADKVHVRLATIISMCLFPLGYSVTVEPGCVVPQMESTLENI